MTVLVLLMLTAFEFSTPFGPGASLLAGSAAGDWRAGFAANPASTAAVGGAGAAAAYSRPYGLEGLQSGCAAAAGRSRALAGGIGFATLGVPGYQEHDFMFVAAAELPAGVAIGARFHTLVRAARQYETDIVGTVDAGVLWQRGTFSLGAAASRLNRPRFAAGDELGLRLAAGGAWVPLPELLLAADVAREDEVEQVLAGVEFRPLDFLAVRGGVQTEPLLFAAGFGVRVRGLVLDYACRFHPELGETHVFGLGYSWN